jgi:hypothetical protein
MSGNFVALIRQFADALWQDEEAICGEWHGGSWPQCDDHELAKGLLDEAHVMAGWTPPNP